MLGKDGLMRVGGKLQHSSLPYDNKHPVIIHGPDPLVRILVVHLHNASLHAGPTSLVGLLSLRFDILGAKCLAKEVSAGCYECHRHYTKVVSQLMGQLPSHCLSIVSLFHKTGVDFAGPLQPRMGHVRKTTIIPGYLCIFVHLTTRAVNIEVVLDLTTEAFLACLIQFFEVDLHLYIVITAQTSLKLKSTGEAYQRLGQMQPSGTLYQYLVNQRTEW